MSLLRALDVSIVIPVYNEEEILRAAIQDLREACVRHAWKFEIVIAQNGSTDRTLEIAQELAQEFSEVSVQTAAVPDYGLALRNGILCARGKYVICDEIDLRDADFYPRALAILERGDADLVIGSKAMRGACDRRPFIRRLATRVITQILRIGFGFRGTDTHGLKAMHRAAMLPVVQLCVLNRDLFASELAIRAQRMHKQIVEIPIYLEEKRPPSTALAKRVPRVLADLVRLFYAIRIRGGLGPEAPGESRT